MSLIAAQGVMMAAPSGPPPPNAWQSAVAALNPILWLTFDEASGSFADASGNGNTGTPNNSPLRTQAAIFANMGLSAGFESNNRSVTVASNSALQITGDVTIAIAFKRNGTQGSIFPKIFWKPTDYSNGRNNYGLTYVRDTNLMVFRVNSSLSYYDALSTTAFADATSYWVVGRRSGTEVSIWVNGVKEATATLPSSGAALDTSTDAIWIGGQTNDGNDQFTGSLDEPLVFDYALSDTEIADLWAARA